MNTLYRNIFSILFCLVCLSSFAQRTSAIRAVGRAQQKKILIRWGVTDPQAWKASNQYGFEVSRFTVTRDKSMLAKPERKSLGVFKPQPLNNWEAAANQNEEAAIIAQAIYGNTFDVGSSDNSGLITTVNRAQEAEQRFVLSLYAADRNFDAALLAGWGLVDTDVKANEKYLYRIKSAVPTRTLSIDSTAVFIGLEDYRELPVVTDIGVLFTDKSATLTWDYEGLKDYYNSYVIERSPDGTNFQAVSDNPITKMGEEENKKASGRMHYIDTLAGDNVTYHYRVRGVTAFSEVGPPSQVVSGKSKKLLAYVPHITYSVVNESGNLDIEWEFDLSGNSRIKGFTLSQSQTEKGPYVAVVKDIEPTRRTALYDKLFSTNYFTITAEALEGESRVSMPVLVQPLDSIPPAIPTGVNAHVDSSGVVKVSWNANTEKDLLGYKVFRAYTIKSELTSLTDSLFMGTSFIDTVSMKMTNRKIFYAITALDRRFNQSISSPRVLAMKPDIIAPTSPAFTRYDLFDYQVRLNWADAQDRDVASHSLFRKKDNEKEWMLIKKFNATTPGAYTDTDVLRGHLYAYTLISKDSSGLESKPATPVSLKVPGNPDDLSVHSLKALVNRDQRYIELFWTDDLKNAEEYHLYKNKKGDPVTLWKIVKQNEKRAVDDKPIINSEYTYGIRVVTRTGQMSRMKWVVVNY